MKLDLQIGNRDLLESYFIDYQKDKNSVSKEWQNFFEMFPVKENISLSFEMNDLNAYRLIEAYREFGHLSLSFDLLKKENSYSGLNFSHFGFSPADLDKLVPTFGLFKQSHVPLSELVERLKQLYTEKIGYEYIGFTSREVELYLQKAIEERSFSFLPEEKKKLLEELCTSELFEAFLHTKYPGQKRFSLEGSETLIPILSFLLNEASLKNVGTFVIGMAHRGRLNVLSNILKKSYSAIFEEFHEGFRPKDLNHSGDVKYHKGFSTRRVLDHGKEVAIYLTSNPSHLESVAPVALGQAFAFQKMEPEKLVLPILIHGDAALSGQGVVYETLQLTKLEGYTTFGAIHLVINNHIGFTTLPKEGRSTKYCTDIAKAFGAPIFHVSVEDPEACLMAAALALEIRNRFQIDVFIDLNGFRKYGHNESDEPAFTQPLEYQVIKNKKSPRKLYEEQLILQGVVTPDDVLNLENSFKNKLQKEIDALEATPQVTNLEEVKLKRVNSAVPRDFIEWGKKSFLIPEGFTPHPKLKKLLAERIEMCEGKIPVDFATAETLSFVSLLNEGIAIRLTGQDVRRGTFSQRHAVWCDQKEETIFSPLEHLNKTQAVFECYNSPLSEYACLGFEFGVSTIWNKELTLWEAQFGDFANGAQIIIDQYLSTSEDKWGITSNLTLLLPHGYEGQGPEHSSARVERFLSLCGKDNMIVVNPTTSAQYFHLLRRQALNEKKRPLIILTPKALLRDKQAFSAVEELERGSFQEILSDEKFKAETLIICSGKIYYDLLKRRRDEALIRIEQLYPLNEESLTSIIAKYKEVKRFFFAQEEPQNMGAWSYLEPKLKRILGKITYVGREVSASPATGFPSLHKEELEKIMDTLFSN